MEASEMVWRIVKAGILVRALPEEDALIVRPGARHAGERRRNPQFITGILHSSSPMRL
jgi:hypothetical protein